MTSNSLGHDHTGLQSVEGGPHADQRAKIRSNSYWDKFSWVKGSIFARTGRLENLTNLVLEGDFLFGRVPS